MDDGAPPDQGVLQGTARRRAVVRRGAGPGASPSIGVRASSATAPAVSESSVRVASSCAHLGSPWPPSAWRRTGTPDPLPAGRRWRPACRSCPPSGRPIRSRPEYRRRRRRSAPARPAPPRTRRWRTRRGRRTRRSASPTPRGCPAGPDPSAVLDEVSRVDPHRARTLGSDGPGGGDGGPGAGVDVVGVHQQGGPDAEGGELGGERHPLVEVGQRERVRRRARRRDSEPAAGLEVRGAVEAGEEGGAGGSDRRASCVRRPAPSR